MPHRDPFSSIPVLFDNTAPGEYTCNMKKLQIGNEPLKQADIDQVDDIIYAFMEIRAGFDAMLPGEMARIRGEIGGPQRGREPAGGANSEVFFRTSTYRPAAAR